MGVSGVKKFKREDDCNGINQNNYKILIGQLMLLSCIF